MARRIRLGVLLSELGQGSRRKGPADAETERALHKFCSALSRQADLEVVPYAAPRYDRLLTRLKLGEVELAWLSPMLALHALRFDVAPVAIPERGDALWYWAALFASQDSPISSVADLVAAGARAAWVDPESASGYLVIRAALSADGADVTRLFRDEKFVRSHRAVVREVLSDPSCVGASYLHLDGSGGVLRAGWGDAPVRVLKRAGPIPSDVLAASATLEEAVVGRLREALVSGHDPELGEAARGLFATARFAPADRAQLSHLHALGRYLILSPR